jgi:hypothetical protein
MTALVDEALNNAARHAAQLADDARRMHHFARMVATHRIKGRTSIGMTLAAITISRRTARVILAAVVAPEADVTKTPPFAKWFTCWVPPLWAMLDYWPMLIAALACFGADAETCYLLRKIGDAKRADDRAAAVAALFGPQGRLDRHRFIVDHPPPVFRASDSDQSSAESE